MMEKRLSSPPIHLVVDVIVLLEIPWFPWYQVDMNMLHSLTGIWPILQPRRQDYNL